ERPQNPQQFAFQVKDVATGEVQLPKTGEVVPPQVLGGTPAAEEAGVTRRQQLARWLVSAENPYFARATVNRDWAMLFGRGLVHPFDDRGDHTPASHPLLLDELTRHFIASGFDQRRLLGTMCRTRAYQQSSAAPADPPRPELFAVMAIKPMTAEQLYDSLA